MSGAKRFKWEPAALMALVLGLGLWIAFGPGGAPSFPVRPGALTQAVRIGTERGVLEAARDAGASEYTFRLHMPGMTDPAKIMTRAEAESILGPRPVEQTLGLRHNRLFRAFNITSWSSLVWIGIGLLGQAAFSGRMILQWIVSERRRVSVITESFWWFSLFGGVTLFSYFVWRQDPIGILGQASGIVIYARNIRLLRKQGRRAARAAGLAAALVDTQPVVVVRAKEVAEVAGTSASGF